MRELKKKGEVLVGCRSENRLDQTLKDLSLNYDEFFKPESDL